MKLIADLQDDNMLHCDVCIFLGLLRHFKTLTKNKYYENIGQIVK